jgi:hypothetical protein
MMTKNGSMQLVFPVANEHERLLPEQNRVPRALCLACSSSAAPYCGWLLASDAAVQLRPPTQTSTLPQHTRAHASHCSTTQARKKTNQVYGRTDALLTAIVINRTSWCDKLDAASVSCGCRNLCERAGSASVSRGCWRAASVSCGLRRVNVECLARCCYPLPSLQSADQSETSNRVARVSEYK